jgi:hypothetical protein
MTSEATVGAPTFFVVACFRRKPVCEKWNFIFVSSSFWRASAWCAPQHARSIVWPSSDILFIQCGQIYTRSLMNLMKCTWRYKATNMYLQKYSGGAASFFLICPSKDGPNLKCYFLSFKGRGLCFSLPCTSILQSKLCFLTQFFMI